MSDPGIKYRLDKAVGFLSAVMSHQLAAQAAGASVRWPGRVLCASDGTCISKRGSKGTDWRVHAVDAPIEKAQAFRAILANTLSRRRGAI